MAFTVYAVNGTESTQTTIYHHNPNMRLCNSSSRVPLQAVCTADIYYHGKHVLVVVVQIMLRVFHNLLSDIHWLTEMFGTSDVTAPSPSLTPKTKNKQTSTLFRFY